MSYYSYNNKASTQSNKQADILKTNKQKQKRESSFINEHDLLGEEMTHVKQMLPIRRNLYLREGKGKIEFLLKYQACHKTLTCIQWKRINNS